MAIGRQLFLFGKRLEDKVKESKACGARFGCWVCTLASDLPELKNAGMWDKRLLMLLDFRNWLKEYGNRKENRTGRREWEKEC